MRICLFCSLLLLTTTLCNASDKTNALLKELDLVLRQRDIYAHEKEARINRLKTERNSSLSPERKYNLGYQIIEESKNYNFNTAIQFVLDNLKIAEQEQNQDWYIDTQLQHAFILSMAGLFPEAERVLNSIPRNEISGNTLITYYHRHEQHYGKMLTFVNDKEQVEMGTAKVNLYRDSLLALLPETSTTYWAVKGDMAIKNKDYSSAEEYINKALEFNEAGSHNHAMMSYNMSQLFREKGDTEHYLNYLIQAVISDVKDAIKETHALPELAIWLYNNGDIERAYTYIKYALEEANFYHINFRYSMLSNAFEEITSAYQQKVESQNSTLKSLLFVISFLVVIMIISLFINKKQKRDLLHVRESLDEKNKGLQEMTDTQEHLIRELSESNHIKEAYISHFIDLYSHYIDKYEDYRKMINNKISVKRFDELLKLTDSSSQKANNDVKELYTHFDHAFLAIYPGFVEAINKMLKEEERFDLKPDELNRELRVFALIRLGISDAAKIANFLRCSIQTVYNYRSRMRKRSINENEDIEEKIKLIGGY